MGTPSRDLDYNRKIREAKKNAKQGIKPDTESIKPLLNSYLKSPGSFNDFDDNSLNSLLFQLKATTDDTDPVKQEIIELAMSKPVGLSIAKYLKDPRLIER